MGKRRGNNEGSITKRKDGRWMGRVTIGRNPDGSLKRIAFYGKTRAEVQNKITKALHDSMTGTFTEPNKITLGQWLLNWLEVYQKPPRVTPSTYAMRGILIKNHILPNLGNIQLQKLRPSAIQTLYTEKLEKENLSTQTVRHIHNILFGALKQAQKDGLIPRNIAQDTQPPKVVKTRKMRVLTKEEVNRFLQTCKGHRLYAAFLLELSTGLRRGELLGLTWSVIDLEDGILQVRQQLNRVKEGEGPSKLAFRPLKSKTSYRTIRIPELVLKELKEHKRRQDADRERLGVVYEDNNLVFCTEDGKPLDPRRFTRTYEMLLNKAEVPYTAFHNLRHTFVVMLLEAGQDIKTIQELVGHADISTTLNEYAEVLESMRAKASTRINDVLSEILNTPQDKNGVKMVSKVQKGNKRRG